MSLLKRVESALAHRFEPLSLEVGNFSHEHGVPEGSETHLKVTIVSEAFVGKRQVQRHRMIYQALSSELQEGLHALQLQTLAPEEASAELISPQCRGGSKKDGG
jgi:BolA family transcriptional regulator, general stress-responsive regulator